jgi:hypothetical protein
VLFGRSAVGVGNRQRQMHSTLDLYGQIFVLYSIAHHPVLAGVVGRAAGQTDQPPERRTVDDCAAALLFHLERFVLHERPDAAHVHPIDTDRAVGGSR